MPQLEGYFLLDQVMLRIGLNEFADIVKANMDVVQSIQSGFYFIIIFNTLKTRLGEPPKISIHKNKVMH